LTGPEYRGPDMLGWDEPTFQLKLVDRRGLPERRRDGKRRPPYGLSASRGPWFSIPGRAFEFIIEQASSHGLKVVRKTESAGRVPGTYVEVVITPE
jgi:hypothetical protein